MAQAHVVYMHNQRESIRGWHAQQLSISIR